jgi:hypothetical protein
MTKHEFLDIEGVRRRCVHPEGQEPLLADWHAGTFDTHWNWDNEKLWRDIAKRAAAEQTKMDRALDKRRAKSWDASR